MKVEKSIDKKASIPLKNDAPSVLKAYANTRITRLEGWIRMVIVNLMVT